MSPTYAYAVDENGDYVSSDMYIYNGRDVLSTYVIKECYSANIHSVSFMDNLYGNIVKYAFPGSRVYADMKADEKDVSSSPNVLNTS